MSIVERYFSQLGEMSNEADTEPRPLSDFLSYPAIVILGDPGAGKTTNFKESARAESNAVFVPIRDFLALGVKHWEGKTLYLDGLDEQRTKTEDGRGVLDRIRTKLDQLDRPRFRLSCRAADWYGRSEKERLQAVSPDGKVLVLRLEPLSDSDIITIAAKDLTDPTDFLAQAKRRGIDPLLRNPQTLLLILAEVQGNVWPTTKADLFQKACARLLQEINPEHSIGLAGCPSLDVLLTAAQYLCAVHLCAGTKGHAVNPQDADAAFPYIGEIGGNQEALVIAARRRIFESDGSGRLVPIHRTIAEYLSGRYFAHLIRTGFPLKRILSLVTGYDGGTLAELRGVYAWFACLCEEEATTLIRRDPLGIVLYGDAALLSPSSKRMLMESLRGLALKNPGFRAHNWSDEPFGTLASPEMIPFLDKILRDPTEPPVYLGCVLDAIQYGPLLPELGPALMQVILDNDRMEGARVSALDAYHQVCANDLDGLKRLLVDIDEGRVRDHGHRLRGKLFYMLYPDVLKPHEIGHYLVSNADHHINAYTMFVAHELVPRTNPEDLVHLLNSVNINLLAESSPRFIWEHCLGQIIFEILKHHGDNANPYEIYDWLGKILDRYQKPIVRREEEAAIQSWLTSRPSVVQGLFRHWLAITVFENPRLELHYFWCRLHSAPPPLNFHKWLLGLAEEQEDQMKAEFLFREAIHGSTLMLRGDGLTLEELFLWANRDTRFRDVLNAELCWKIPDWRREDAESTRESKRREEASKALRLQQLSEQLAMIRTGAPTNELAFLGKAYFGLFHGLDRDTDPRARLIAFTNSEITAAAFEGFAAALHRPEIPSPHMIADAEPSGPEYLLGYPILAGLTELAGRSNTDLCLLPSSALQAGLAFHHAIISDKEREWVQLLIESMPDLVAEALIAYWRTLLAMNTKYVPGLYDLTYKPRMKPIAQRASIPLLRDFANCQEENLTYLLHAALRNGDRGELLLLAQQNLAHTTLVAENRALWCASAYILDYHSFQDELSEQARTEEQAARILKFLCLTKGNESEAPYPLAREALKFLITTMGHSFHASFSHGRAFSSIPEYESPATLIRSLIYRLGQDLTHEGSLALAELYESPELDVWRDEVADVMADQSRQRREYAFRYPTVVQITETLRQGRPANAADLQALVSSHLLAIGEELRNGPTDGWKGMWNVTSQGKTTNPRPEEICRDRLLEILRPRLFPLGVAAEPEGQYAERKRADIKAVTGPLNLPVEIKRHMHTDIWTAPREQLQKLYVRDPGTSGRGIYLVFWFGIAAGNVPKTPSGIARPQTATQLQMALRGTLQPPEDELLEIIVIDCEPPGIPS